jgi:hypothetical protein
MAGQDAERLRPIPGTDEDWAAYIGHHEGRHTTSEQERNYTWHLDREVDSDRESIRRLRSMGKGDVADAIIDFRALSAWRGGQTHATGIFIDQNPGPMPTNTDAIDAAANFRQHAETMVDNYLKNLSEGEMHNLGIDYDADWNYSNNPDEFVAVMHRLLDEGHFDNLTNPYEKQYMQAFVDAYERRIIPEIEVDMARRSVAALEGDSKYVAISLAMEKLRAGETLDITEQAEVIRLVRNRATELEPDVWAHLMYEYNTELAPYLLNHEQTPFLYATLVEAEAKSLIEQDPRFKQIGEVAERLERGETLTEVEMVNFLVVLNNTIDMPENVREALAARYGDTLRPYVGNPELKPYFQQQQTPAPESNSPESQPIAAVQTRTSAMAAL